MPYSPVTYPLSPMYPLHRIPHYLPLVPCPLFPIPLSLTPCPIPPVPYNSLYSLVPYPLFVSPIPRPAIDAWMNMRIYVHLVVAALFIDSCGARYRTSRSLSDWRLPTWSSSTTSYSWRRRSRASPSNTPTRMWVATLTTKGTSRSISTSNRRV